jgi:hypothetical protein
LNQWRPQLNIALINILIRHVKYYVRSARYDRAVAAEIGVGRARPASCTGAADTDPTTAKIPTRIEASIVANDCCSH